MSNINPAQNQKKPRRKKEKNLVKFFFKTLIISLSVLAAAGFGVVASYNHFNNTDASVQAVAKAIDSNLKQGISFSDMFSSVKEHTNFLILGVDGLGDGGAHTDFMMAGSFNSKTKEISLISLPRDTYTIMPENRRQVLKENKLWTPANGAMKLTEVSHYAESKFGTEFIVKQVEELLQIEIEYYVKIDLSGFRYLVDEIGGVTFDVPQLMIYDDPAQDLHINLKPGVQVLNGEQAEGVVRYRKSNDYGTRSPGYPMGDLDRVEVQQDFMKAMISQVLSSEDIINNIEPMAKTLYNYVKTNYPITEVPKYVKYAKDISADKIESYTLPGVAQNGSPSYFIADTILVAELVDSIFYSTLSVQTEIGAIVTSKDKTIQVLNGGYTAGLASVKQEMLNEKGYNVTSVSDYSGTKKDYTRIVVNKKGLGSDLQVLFEGSKIEVDKTLTGDYDIVIVLGTNES